MFNEHNNNNENIGVETAPAVKTKKSPKSSLRAEEAALDKQMKELEAKIKAEKEKIKEKRKDLELKADREIAKAVRKWHSGSAEASSLEENIFDILGER